MKMEESEKIVVITNMVTCSKRDGFSFLLYLA